jgi:hypothetical protein
MVRDQEHLKHSVEFGETQTLGEKPVLSDAYSTTYPLRAWPGMETGPQIWEAWNWSPEV